MWEEFFKALALHPDFFDRYAELAASGNAGRTIMGMDAQPGRLLLRGERSAFEDEDDWEATEGTRYPEPTVINGVAVLPLYGLLAPSLPFWVKGTSTEQFSMQFLSAMNNPEIREVVIRINSPGGLVDGTPELSDLIYRHRGTKPITAFAVNGTIASAAYWIGSAADRLYATRSTEVGSIGVIWAHYDMRGMAEQAGVRVSYVSIPEDKAIGREFRQLSDGDRQKLLDTWLSPIYRQFVAGVARNRGVAADEVTEQYGRGLTLLAEEAAAVGMIDGVRDWNEFRTDLAGGQSTAPSNGQGSPLRISREGKAMKWSQRLRAIMFAAGIIEAIDAEDPACAMALRVWCRGRRVEVPETDDQAFALVQAAMGEQTAQPSTPQPTAAAGERQPVGDTQQTTTTQAAAAVQPVDVSGEVQRALQAEHRRQGQIRSRASLLADQMGVEIPAADLTAALEDPGVTPEAFSERVLTAAQNSQRPVGRIENGTAALDRFTSVAALAICARSGPELARMAMAEGATQEQAQEHVEGMQAALRPQGRLSGADANMVRDVSRMSFLQIARESVRLAGRSPRSNDDAAWANAFLQMAGTDQFNQFAAGHPGIEGGLMASAPIHGPGDFPNLMGMVAQQTSYFALNVAPVSYWRWATRHDDAQNFNPQEILQFYGSTRFDEHVDTHPPGQATFSEDTAWIQVNEYSKGAKLSERMIIQNQLSTFLRMLVQFQIAAERTVNELVVNLLIDNVASPFDGVALFDSTHSNVRASGNPPSVTENNAMRLLLAQQTIPGDTLEAGLTFDVALYGSTHISAAELQYLPAYRTVPTTQDGVNVYTGRVEPIYEPLLSATDPIWYALSRSMMVVGIIYSFLQGSGPGGRRVTYYDPATRCQSFDYYLSAGSALVNYQPFARNAGTGAS